MPEQETLAPTSQGVSKPKGRFEIPDDAVPPAGKEVKAPETPAASAPESAQKPEDQAPSEKPAEELPAQEDTPEQAAKRQSRRFERRLDKAYKRAAEAQARAELLERQLAEARQATPQGQQFAAQGKPRLEDFESIEKYDAAVIEWAKSQTAKEFEAKQRAEAAKRYQQKLVSDWEAKVEQGEEKYADWREVVGELKPDNPITVSIIEAENGHEIAYYLATNPKEVARITSLSPLAQVREIGKLEATLLATPGKPPMASKAPAPIQPVSGAAPATDTGGIEDPELAYAEWLKRRRKQVYGR